MSDFNSSLPVRTETAGDVISKICDSTVTSQQLKVNADGSINITDNSGSITVDGSVTVSSTDLDIRDLSHTQDSVKIGDGVDFLAIDASGNIGVTDAGGSLTVDATDLDIRNLSASQDNVAISDGTDSLAINADGSINITDNGSSITVDGSVTVSATDLDIRNLSHSQDSVKVGDGTDFLEVNADGSINVKVVDGTPGTSITDYNTTAAVAGGASDTHTYTSTGNFYLTQVEASGSGKMKIEVQVNSITKFVQFNSTANPNMSIMLSQPILATSGQTVTIIRTNRDNQAQDVYSTISGYNS